MEIKFSNSLFPYSGLELRPHWIFEEFGLSGDAAISWIGPCEVGLNSLVDIEDAETGGIIAADEMLHFLIEHFLFPDLQLNVYRQRLLIVNASELITEMSGIIPKRSGNDLFVDGGKLSVSIATVSPVSALIHFAINVTNVGTPVETSCMEDLEIDPKEFAISLLKKYRDEVLSIYHDLGKVKPRM